MIATGVTQFKDTQGEPIDGVTFEELIGVCVNEAEGMFYAYAKCREGRFFCSHISETGPGSFFVRPWYEVEEAAALASAMTEGKNWHWVHKEICTTGNWEIMKKSISWAIASARGKSVTEPNDVYSIPEFE